METLKMLFPVVSGGLIVPIVSYLKEKLPGDFPVQPPIYSAILACLVTWLLSIWLYPEMTTDEIITYALGTLAVSQFGHAVKKTKEESK